MPRRSSGGRSAARTPPRPAPMRNSPQPVHQAPPPAPVRSGGGSILGGIGSTIAQGMAFGTGSAVAHRAVDTVMGPRTIQHETAVSQASEATAAPVGNTTNGMDSCNIHSKAFQDCINNYGSEISKCQFYLDMLAYLKKSLMLELLKYPETFEDKVVGCFVRIKNDPKGFYYLVQKAYQLGQVTGIKKTEQTYKIGERSTDIVLCVSNFSNDIKISMLSDDDIEEEECEVLRQLVKKGLFTQPTITELERKIRSVHEDIVNHWINREIVKLQKQIDRANDKGWRKELGEYIDRRELLRTPEERLRLVKEIPKVIPDTSDTKANMDGPLNLQGVNRGGLTSGVEVCVREVEGDETVTVASDSDSNVKEKVAEKMPQGDKTKTSESNADSQEKVAEKMLQGTISNSAVQMLINLDSEPKSKISENQASSIEEKSKINDEEKYPNKPKTSEIQIIDLDMDDDDDITTPVPKESGSTKTDASLRSQAMWHYRDPSGNEQGPFTLYSLWYWRECGYFDDNFKVWKSGQDEGDAVLLTVALRPSFQIW